MYDRVSKVMEKDGRPLQDQLFQPVFNGGVLEDLEEVLAAFSEISGQLTDRERLVSYKYG